MYQAPVPSRTAIRVTGYSRPPTELEILFYYRIIRRLSERRIALGLTQEELDDALGVSDGQVAKWESFARLPGAFMFMCWSNRLGVVLAVEDYAAPLTEEELAQCPKARPLPQHSPPVRGLEARQMPLW